MIDRDDKEIAELCALLKKEISEGMPFSQLVRDHLLDARMQMLFLRKLIPVGIKLHNVLLHKYNAREDDTEILNGKIAEYQEVLYYYYSHGHDKVIARVAVNEVCNGNLYYGQYYAEIDDVIGAIMRELHKEPTSMYGMYKHKSTCSHCGARLKITNGDIFRKWVKCEYCDCIEYGEKME